MVGTQKMTRQKNRNSQALWLCFLCVASQGCLVWDVGEEVSVSPEQERCAGPWMASEHWTGGRGDYGFAVGQCLLGSFLGNLFSIHLFSQLMFIEPNERPLDSKELNQSIKSNPEYSLEGLIY